MIPKVNTDRKAFILPGGYYLAYAFPWTKGSQYTWTNFDVGPTFNKRLESKSKKDCIKLGCWSSDRDSYYDRQVLIMADFDHLYDEFTSFNSLAKYMENTYGKTGLVIRSFSGKVKIVFVVHLKPGININQQHALETLRVLLNERDYNHIDKSLGALSLSFLTKESFLKLKIELPYKPVHELQVSSKPVKPDHVYRTFKSKIPEFLIPFIGKNKKKEKFIRILLECKMLMYDGFNLPLKKLAKECEVDPKTISSWIRHLKTLNLLECIDETYIIGKKAKTFKAKNELLTFLSSTKKEKITIPSKIDDGKWYKTLFIVRTILKNETLYTEWFNSLPDNHLKDRKRMFNNNLKELRRVG
jgi:hypothetical protein